MKPAPVPRAAYKHAHSRSQQSLLGTGADAEKFLAISMSANEIINRAEHTERILRKAQSTTEV
jgi:hypothetical protein